MKMINIYQAKTHLSRYLRAASPGERIVICRRNVPVAEIRPLPRPGGKPRPVGLARGAFAVPPAFFEPLPDDLLDAFGG